MHGSMEWIVRGGTVVTPEGARRTDVAIRDGRILSLGPADLAGDARIADAEGCLVLPGIVDAHVHLELPTPKGVSADSFLTGTRAAACGGVTTVVDFALFEREQSLEERLRLRRRAADPSVSIDYGLHLELGAADVGRTAEIRRAAAWGQRSFKTYMAFPDPEVQVGPDEIRRFGEALAGSGSVLMVHAEDGLEVERRQEALRSKGRLSPKDHALARPPELEARAIDEALEIGRQTGVGVYVVHVSSKQGLEAARGQRARGAKVHVETCPQYLLLTDEVYEGEDGVQFLANPPLRKAEDCEALWEGVRDGTVDTVATDHCPFRASVKNRYGADFSEVPKGLPGVETLWPLIYTEAVVKRGIPLERCVEMLSTNPARIFGLFPRKGQVAVGGDADLTVFDPRPEVRVEAGALHMNTDFNPYESRVVRGRTKLVFLRGVPVYREGTPLGRGGEGRYVGG